jgi:hypothetical protein
MEIIKPMQKGCAGRRYEGKISVNPMCAKINHTQSNFQTARRFPLFIFIIIAFQLTRERIFTARKPIDETASHWRSVCNLNRLHLSLAAARVRTNVHLTGLLHQNCSHHTD